jgi:outer membrane biogenesis lipoprotein LolB
MRSVSSALATLAVAFLLASCATPTVMPTQKVTDNKLSCEQIEQQVDEAESFRQKAQAEKGATGKNVAAVLLFWPAALATYHNIGEATEAADARKLHLLRLYAAQGCGRSNGDSAAESP